MKIVTTNLCCMNFFIENRFILNPLLFRSEYFHQEPVHNEPGHSDWFRSELPAQGMNNFSQGSFQLSPYFEVCCKKRIELIGDLWR